MARERAAEKEDRARDVFGRRNPLQRNGGRDPLAAAATDGPFDLVVHAVGTATYPLRGCRALLKPRGVVTLVVIRPADYPALLHRDVRTVLGRPTRAALEQLVHAVVRGEYVPIIEEKMPLAEAERAHTISRAGKVVGKLLLIP